MLEAGRGFFAMWCGIAPALAPDFSLMHTRDHLPEHMAYLGEGGIEWARRYEEGKGTLPPCFVLYGMSGLERLVDPAWAGATVHETEWFKALRPHYRDRIAHHGRVLGSAGAGCGGSVATFLVTLAPHARVPSPTLDTLLDGLTRLPPVTTASLGLVEWTVPIRIGQAPPEPGPGDDGLGVLLVESFDRSALSACLPAVAEALSEAGVTVRASGHYGLSYALGHRDIARLRHFRRDDALVARRRSPRPGEPGHGTNKGG